MIKAPEINFVAFTGSVAGGKMVEQCTAGLFKGSGLELGGKDPAYVRADANVSHAVETVVDGAFFNSGQSCCGIERAYVHESIFEEFLAGAITAVQAYELNDPTRHETTLGPLVKQSAAEFASPGGGSDRAGRGRGISTVGDSVETRAQARIYAPPLFDWSQSRHALDDRRNLWAGIGRSIGEQ